MSPKISVIMPVLNGEKYLRQAIESILSQTFADFEFIIINDGSTDKTEEIIKSFPDQRIVYIQNETNLGLSRSFNIGISKARGEYIARMDADDISLPRRFEKQLAFLNNNPEIGIAGTTAIIIDERGEKKQTVKKPLTHLEIKWQALFSTPLIHPSIMARSQILKQNQFDEKLNNSEDYELWSRLMFEKSVKFANLEESLLLYRVYSGSFTQNLNRERRLASAANTIRNIERYTLPSPHEKGTLIKLRQDAILPIHEILRVWRLYIRVAKAFSKKENFNPSLLPLIIFLSKYKLRNLLAHRF